MDTEPTVNCKPSVCCLGIDEKGEKKMTDEETSVHEDEISADSIVQQAGEPVCRSDCQWPDERYQQETGTKSLLAKIGHFGLGAWRVGKVPDDVIIEKV